MNETQKNEIIRTARERNAVTNQTRALKGALASLDGLLGEIKARRTVSPNDKGVCPKCKSVFMGAKKCFSCG